MLAKRNNGMPVRRAIPADRADRDKYNGLKFAIVHIINNKDGRMKQPTKFECITHRTNGKDGLARKLALGKRTNYNARTIANPEATNEFGEIMVPKALARTITVKETVTVINRDKLSRLLQEGKIKRISVGSGVHADDIFGINARIKGYVLQPSDVVHRNLMDGDIGLINRQPSLHRLSMLGYRIRIADSEDNKILGIHLGATAGLNADFDGDELNFHAPQELEAIIEARTIANVENSIMFESSNVNVAGVAFDSLAAAYKLTSDQTIFTKKQFYELLSATYEGWV